MGVSRVLLLKTFITLPDFNSASTQMLVGKQGEMSTFYYPTKAVQERHRSAI